MSEKWKNFKHFEHKEPEKPIVFFDLETTGIKPLSEHKIVQIAMLKVDKEWNIVDGFETLLNPGMPIPPDSTEIHGITDDMVYDKPRFREVLPRVMEFFEGSDVAGYNIIRFDWPMLINEIRNAGELKWPNSDVRLFDPQIIEWNLNANTLAGAYKRHTGRRLESAHNAMADTVGALEVFKSQMFNFGDVEPLVLVKNWDALHRFCNDEVNYIDSDRKFYLKHGEAYIGTWSNKHPNQKASDCMSYLRWMITRSFCLDTKIVCALVLEGKFGKRDTLSDREISEIARKHDIPV
jgi:DNA polymerase-3 subunit epsilon